MSSSEAVIWFSSTVTPPTANSTMIPAAPAPPPVTSMWFASPGEEPPIRLPSPRAARYRPALAPVIVLFWMVTTGATGASPLAPSYSALMPTASAVPEIVLPVMIVLPPWIWMPQPPAFMIVLSRTLFPVP